MGKLLHKSWGRTMFINLGDNHTVHSKEIILIIDHNAVLSSSIMEEIIKNKRKQSKVIGSIEVAKSVVITNDLIYFSSLSVLTLKKRSSVFSVLSKSEIV